MTELDFKAINFGKAEASNESDLLIDGFLDEKGYIPKIISGNKFIIIGQKGSGKTAIATKLQLLSDREGQFVASIQMLDEFDYDGFAGVIPGKGMPENKYSEVWQLLISLKLIELYSRPGCIIEGSDSNLIQLKKALEKLGILPNDFKSIIRLFKKREFRIDAKVLQFTSSDKELTNDDIRKLSSSVVKQIYGIKPMKRHLLILDGLDSVLGSREKQYQILSSLVRTAYLMNHRFKENGVPTTIVVLCRKDVLEKLNDPNRSKYVQDSGIVLNWYTSPETAKESDLYKLINLRGKISLGRDVDIMDEFFPASYNGHDTFRHLLDNTRYTPRDLIQLMNCIQACSKSTGASSQSIRDGLNTYSEDYLLMEVKDSLVGMLRNEEIEAAFKAIRSIGRDNFTFQEFAAEVEPKYNPLELLNSLYVSGAIGNVEVDDDGNRFRTTKFRNPNSLFNEKREISVNHGLRKALMVHRLLTVNTLCLDYASSTIQ